MPRKPLHPTIYPPPTKDDSIQAFASIIARSAVRIAQSEENQKPAEPGIKQYNVDMETSVNDGNIEKCSRLHLNQPTLFGGDES